ncbi:hypothetical protein B0G93_12019 [Bacillus sp. V-88]|jgi:hypothetical protein|nr:hypothetical protein B0G93_12019 [Bacillus sp. V-88]SLK24126.1 hypothetical protein SAMN06295884_12019 [Bacillus sp. V-88]
MSYYGKKKQYHEEKILRDTVRRLGYYLDVRLAYG